MYYLNKYFFFLAATMVIMVMVMVMIMCCLTIRINWYQFHVTFRAIAWFVVYFIPFAFHRALIPSLISCYIVITVLVSQLFSNIVAFSPK